MDFAEGELKNEQFAIKFGLTERTMTADAAAAGAATVAAAAAAALAAAPFLTNHSANFFIVQFI